MSWVHSTTTSRSPSPHRLGLDQIHTPHAIPSPKESSLSIQKQEIEQATQLSESPQPQETDRPTRSDSATRSKTLLPAVDTWFYECISILLSLACFIAVIVILITTSGNRPPSFSYGITLNTVISLLGTVCRSSLIYVIGACISQLKWIWFHKEKKQKLKDLQLFDSASCRPLGSLLIFLEHRGLSLVSWGAVIMIMALVLGPFLQQLVTYPTRDVWNYSGRAGAPQTVVLLPEYLHADPRTIMYTGIWLNDFEVRPTCPSGNCTWEPFQSVGMCSQCEDVSTSSRLIWIDQSKINTTNPGIHTARFEIELPRSSTRAKNASVTVDVQPSDFTYLRLGFLHEILWTPFYHASGLSTESYMGIKDPLYLFARAELDLADQTVAGIDPMLDLGLTFKLKNVTQCVLTLCARNYTMSVLDGHYNVTISPPDFGIVFENPQMDQSLPRESQFCWKPGNGPANISMTNVSLSSFENRPAFAFCPTDTYCLYDYFEEERTQYNSSMSFTTWGNPDVKQTYGIFYNETFVPKTPILDRMATIGLEDMVGNIAASFTKAGLTASNTGGIVNGTIISREVYVSVQWKWLVFPSALMVGGVVFFVITTKVNCQYGLKERLWKSSILAVIFHGLDELERKDEGNRFETVSRMNHEAEGLKVELEEDRWGRFRLR